MDEVIIKMKMRIDDEGAEMLMNCKADTIANEPMKQSNMWNICKVCKKMAK